MLSEKQLISILIVGILSIIFISWFLIVIRTLSYQKRVKEHVIDYEDNYISLIDKLINMVTKFRNKLARSLRKSKIDTIFYSNNTKEDKVYYSKLLASKIILSLTVIIVYLILSLITLTKVKLAFILLVFIIGFYIPDFINYIKLKLAKKKIENDLLKAISLMNNSFKSGKSIIQAIEVVYKELDGPIASEFEKIHKDILHGLSLTTAFKRFNERVELDDIKYITSSLLILNETGGNITSVFTSIENSLYTRRSLELEFKAIVASSRLIFYFFTFLPVLLWVVMGIGNNTYFTIFFNSVLGILLFIIILLLYIIYIIVIKSIMKIEKY